MSHRWLNEDSRTFLSRDYLMEGVTPEQRIEQIADAVLRYMPHLNATWRAKFIDYVHRGWISFSTPVWTNFGLPRGLPISCNGSFVADTTADILGKVAEIGMQTKHGSGTSAYLGALRPYGAPISTGGTSDGPVHFLEQFQATVTGISQAAISRGNCGVYLDVEHADIEAFLEILETTEDDEGNAIDHPIQHLSMGVCISDAWMVSMLNGDKNKRRIWARIIRKRFEKGYPYIFWTDNVNRNTVDVYKAKAMRIHASNLCSEIMLPSSEHESFVCCLSSVNALYYDEWKDTDLPEVMVIMLDAVITEYAEKTQNIRFMDTAHRFAVNHRAIGVGVLGWHSLLQSKMLAFESLEAKRLNVEVFRLLQQKTLEASKMLATHYGSPPVLTGYGRRNTTTMAIAPTKSSSFILGQVSEGVQPYNMNYFVKKLAKGTFSFRNPFLATALTAHGMDTDDVWDSILLKDGSVQHLTDLPDNVRAVFKTMGEISQYEILEQAAMRQPFIDQGQSVNLMIHPDTSAKDLSDLLIESWRLKLKSLYYQLSTNPAQEYARELASCVACEA